MKQKLFKCLASLLVIAMSLLDPCRAVLAAPSEPVQILLQVEEGGRIDWTAGGLSLYADSDHPLELELDIGQSYEIEIVPDPDHLIESLQINDEEINEASGQNHWNIQDQLTGNLKVLVRFTSKSKDVNEPAQEDKTDPSTKKDESESPDPDQKTDEDPTDGQPDEPEPSEIITPIQKNPEVPKSFALSALARNGQAQSVARVDTFYDVPLPTGGGILTNSLWILDNGFPAFCANSVLAPPTAGARAKSVREIDHTTLRKVLYYGFGGVDNRLAKKGYTGEQQVIITNDLASFAYGGRSFSTEVAGGYNWTYCMKALWNEITSLPDPKDYVVVVLDFDGTGTNYLDQTVAKQPLVYGHAMEKGSLKIVKKSANETITQSSGRYSLEGAEFEIRQGDSWQNGKKVGTLRSKADGSTDVFTGRAGTYWIKETKSPKGHVLQSDPVKAVLSDAYPQSRPLVVTLTNQPRRVAPELIVQKVNAKTGTSEARLANAQYKVEWIDADPAVKPEEAHGSLSWILKTDANGEIRFDADHLVEGPQWSLDQDKAVLPEGWLRIQETKAPAGFQIDPEVYFLPLKAEENQPLTLNKTAITSKEQPIEIELIKVDGQTNQPLADARFTLQAPDGSKTEIQLDKNGKARLELNQMGTWILLESQAPVGYQKLKGKARFLVSETGIETELEGEFAQATQKGAALTIPNTPNPYDFELLKVSSEGQPLAKAKIRLSKDPEGKQEIARIESDENGQASVKGLKEGTFYVAEIVAPQGYRLPLDETGLPVVHRIDARFDVETRHWIFTVDGQALDQNPSGFDVRDGDCLIWQLTNQKQPVLPATGQNGWMLPLMGTIALMSGSMMKKREENQEKK